MNDLSKMYQVYVNKELQVNKNEILNVARLRIDTIKNHTEIPNRLSLEDLFLKIYQSMMNVSSTYSSQDYQNTIDDYFSLGFQLGIDLDEIIDHI